MNEEIIKYAKMITSMSTDYLLGDYDEQLYLEILDIANKKMQGFRLKTGKKEE